MAKKKVWLVTACKMMIGKNLLMIEQGPTPRRWDWRIVICTKGQCSTEFGRATSLSFAKKKALRVLAEKLAEAKRPPVK